MLACLPGFLLVGFLSPQNPLSFISTYILPPAFRAHPSYYRLRYCALCVSDCFVLKLSSAYFISPPGLEAG